MGGGLNDDVQSMSLYPLKEEPNNQLIKDEDLFKEESLVDGQIPEINQATEIVAVIESVNDNLALLGRMVSAGGMNVGFALEALEADPDLQLPPANYFTEDLTRTQYEPTLEAVGSRVGDMIRDAYERLVEMARKVAERIRQANERWRASNPPDVKAANQPLKATLQLPAPSIEPHPAPDVAKKRTEFYANIQAQLERAGKSAAIVDVLKYDGRINAEIREEYARLTEVLKTNSPIIARAENEFKAMMVGNAKAFDSKLAQEVLAISKLDMHTVALEASHELEVKVHDFASLKAFAQQFSQAMDRVNLEMPAYPGDDLVQASLDMETLTDTFQKYAKELGADTISASPKAQSANLVLAGALRMVTISGHWFAAYNNLYYYAGYCQRLVEMLDKALGRALQEEDSAVLDASTEGLIDTLRDTTKRLMEFIRKLIQMLRDMINKARGKDVVKRDPAANNEVVNHAKLLPPIEKVESQVEEATKTAQPASKPAQADEEADATAKAAQARQQRLTRLLQAEKNVVKEINVTELKFLRMRTVLGTANTASPIAEIQSGVADFHSLVEPFTKRIDLLVSLLKSSGDANEEIAEKFKFVGVGHLNRTGERYKEQGNVEPGTSEWVNAVKVTTDAHGLLTRNDWLDKQTDSILRDGEAIEKALQGLVQAQEACKWADERATRAVHLISNHIGKTLNIVTANLRYAERVREKATTALNAIDAVAKMISEIGPE